jgi:hypothetical protein
MRMPKYICQHLAAHGPHKTDILEAENKSAWKKCRIASAEVLGLTMDHCVAGSSDWGLNKIDTQFCSSPTNMDFHLTCGKLSLTLKY